MWEDIMELKTLNWIKEYLLMLRLNGNSYQNWGYINIDNELKFGDIFLSDIAEYIMYIIAADRQVHIDEVKVYRYITGHSKETISSIKEYIEENNIIGYSYSSKIPKSLKLLVNGLNNVRYRGEDGNTTGLVVTTFGDGDYFSRKHGTSSQKAIAALEEYETLIKLYITIGVEVFEADGIDTFEELHYCKNYIINLMNYISEYSSVPVDGLMAKLMDLLEEMTC